MGIEWIIAGAVAHAPGAIQQHNAVKEAQNQSAACANMISEYRIPPEVEAKIVEEVADPKNYEQIWETLEHFLRKNPRYLIGDHFNAWTCVGSTRLMLHLPPHTGNTGNLPAVVLKNRKMVEGMLAVIYGGHTREQAEKIARAHVYEREEWKRCNRRWHSHFKERPPMFPDLEEPEEPGKEQTPEPTIVGDLWEKHAQNDK